MKYIFPPYNSNRSLQKMYFHGGSHIFCSDRLEFYGGNMYFIFFGCYAGNTCHKFKELGCFEQWYKARLIV